MLVVWYWANNTPGGGELQARQRGCPCLFQLARHADACVRRRHPARPLYLALETAHEGWTLGRMFDPVTRNAAWARRGVARAAVVAAVSPAEARSKYRWHVE